MEKNKNIENYTNETFESIKHIDENGVEFWYARELQKVLEYKDWRKFKGVIEKAKQSCEITGNSTIDWVVDVDKPIITGKDKTEEKLIKDNIHGEKKAGETHNKIGKIVRKAIEEAGGTMPENLPTPKKSLKQLEKESRKTLKENNKGSVEKI